MGSGYKDFVAGQPLRAPEVDGYLMRQSVMTFATEAARDSALSGVLDEGMVTFQKDSNRITFYDGSAWQVLNEPPQTWNVTSFGQPGPVSCTTAYGWYQRSNGVFIAHLAINITGTGVAGNSVKVGTPFTLPSSEAVGGTFVYSDSGTANYTGYIVPSSTTDVAFISNDYANNVGITPSFAGTSPDILRFVMHGRYY